MDFGRIQHRRRARLYLFGVSGPDRFWFRWDDIVRGRSPPSSWWGHRLAGGLLRPDRILRGLATCLSRAINAFDGRSGTGRGRPRRAPARSDVPVMSAKRVSGVRQAELISWSSTRCHRPRADPDRRARTGAAHARAADDGGTRRSAPASAGRRKPAGRRTAEARPGPQPRALQQRERVHDLRPAARRRRLRRIRPGRSRHGPSAGAAAQQDQDGSKLARQVVPLSVSQRDQKRELTAHARPAGPPRQFMRGQPRRATPGRPEGPPASAAYSPTQAGAPGPAPTHAPRGAEHDRAERRPRTHGGEVGSHWAYCASARRTTRP